MKTKPSESAATLQLLDRGRVGRHRAVNQLFARHRRQLRQAIALRIDPNVRARFDASDIVQEAQIEALRRLPTFLAKPPAPFYLWLRFIARERLLNWRRDHAVTARRAFGRELHLPEESSLTLASQLADDGPTPSRMLSEAQRVRQAIGQLSETDQDILLMRNFEGLSNHEVALVLQIEPDAASNRYGRALIRLRKVLLRTAPSEDCSDA